MLYTSPEAVVPDLLGALACMFMSCLVSAVVHSMVSAVVIMFSLSCTITPALVFSPWSSATVVSVPDLPTPVKAAECFSSSES